MPIFIFQETNPTLILLIFGLVIIGIIISYFFSKKKRIVRELQKTPKKQIGRVQQHEYVKLVGKAKGGDNLLIAPLSGRACLCYYVIVQKENDDSWSTYIQEERFQDFFLESQGEMALIKPTRTHTEFRRTYFEIDHKEESGTFNDAKPHLERFLKKHNHKSEGFMGFNKTLRYLEGIIEEEETIAVKGVAEWKKTSEPIDGYSYSRILTLHGTDKQKLIITDYPEALKVVKRKL